MVQLPTIMQMHASYGKLNKVTASSLIHLNYNGQNNWSRASDPNEKVVM